MGSTVQVNLGDVPEAIREGVTREARERDVSPGRLVSEIVAACYGVDVTVTGQRLRTGALVSLRVIRIPQLLADALDAAADGDRRLAKSRLILNCLADHYRLPVESPLNRSLAQPRGTDGRFVGRS